MSFMDELKRRNVFRVGIAYTVLGWVVIQVTDTVAPVLGMPESTLAVVIWIGIIGFPFALLIAWAFELTPEGIKPESQVDRSASIAITTARKIDFIIIGLLTIAIAYFLVDKLIISANNELQPHVDTLTSKSSVTEKSIAVLPFVNMSGDPEQEYFGDGIAEEILNGLAQVPGLRVVARTSAFSFKGKNIDLREVGKTLNASHVLEGSVRKARDRLRITAQLISVEDGYHLWSETYERSKDDIFAIQEEIARAVVSELEIKLGLTDDSSLVRQGTTDSESYNWFLRGSYYIERQTPEDFAKAIESYSKSIELDPQFAGGYGGLAYGLAYGSNFTPYLQVAKRARQAYERALIIDDNQAHALLAKAVDSVLTGYDYIAAERAVQKTFELNINRTLITDAYWWLVLAPQRRFDEALELLMVAEEADPLSSLVKQGIGFNLAWGGDLQASLSYLEAAVEMNPNDSFAMWILSLVYIELGHLETAESTIERLEGLTGPGGFSSWGRAKLHIAREDEAGARKVLEQLIKAYEQDTDSPLHAQTIGVLYVHLGLIEEAVNWFELGAVKPSPFNGLSATIFYDNPALWEHPRFQVLMKNMNLDDVSVASAKAIGDVL